MLALLLGCTPPADPADTAPDDTADTADTGEDPAPACTDLNCDGWPDLVFARNGPATYPAVWWGSPDGLGKEPETALLPSDWTKAVALEDLDNDGDLDVVLSRAADPVAAEVESVVYFTDTLAPWTGTAVALPSHYAHGVAVADLDLDGWKDVALAEHGSDALGYEMDSHVYWGGPDGFTRVTTVPTVGAFGVSAADADGDGWPDLLYSSYYDGAGRELDSLLYLGGPDGFSADRRVALPTVGARGNLLRDVDGDGHIDAVFASFFDGANFALESLVYWGGEDGFDPARVTRLPTIGAHAVEVADFDGDGRNEIVFSAQRADASWETVPQSVVFWGTDSGWGDDVTILATQRAAGLAVADLDADGDLDLAVSNFGRTGDDSTPPDSSIYWTGDGRLNDGERTDLDHRGSDGVAVGPGEMGL